MQSSSTRHARKKIEINFSPRCHRQVQLTAQLCGKKMPYWQSRATEQGGDLISTICIVYSSPQTNEKKKHHTNTPSWSHSPNKHTVLFLNLQNGRPAKRSREKKCTPPILLDEIDRRTYLKGTPRGKRGGRANANFARTIFHKPIVVRTINTVRSKI